VEEKPKKFFWEVEITWGFTEEEELYLKCLMHW
jgi:hypothetical protein